jgi:UDP-4-amino-4,6-dideoxy-N-acetyl-beta-L-altrosamine transaminase
VTQRDPSNVGLPFLPYGRQSLDAADAEAVADVLRGDWLTQGPAVEAFESALCDVTGAEFAVAVSSGTAALHLATLAAGVTPGGAGVTSTFTFVASANCIRYAGGKPLLCDVEESTGLVRTGDISVRLNSSPAQVVIPVHFAGAVADLPVIADLARSAGAIVIEDAAHALGASYEARGEQFMVGSCAHSDMTVFSFHPVKHVTTAEGGAITTNNETLAEELRELRTHGITRAPSRLRTNDGPWYYEQRRLGFNYRISDVHCALGVSQLAKLGPFVERRREIAAMYDAGFAHNDRIAPLAVPESCSSSYHLYVVRLVRRAEEPPDAVADRRRELYLGLRARGIGVQVHYIPVHHQPDYVDLGLSAGDFHGADALYASCVSLPMFPAMKDDDVRRVMSAVDEALDTSDG